MAIKITDPKIRVTMINDKVRMYLLPPLFNAALCARVADAIDALEQQNYGAARDVLISGMQEAEEIILTQVDGSPAK